MATQIIRIIICIVLINSIISCGKKKTEEMKVIAVKPPVAITGLQKKEEPRYKYSGENYRDPFIEVTAEGGRFFSSMLKDNEEALPPNLGALTLKGIVGDSKVKIALLWTPTGTYFLKNGKLYDGRNRIVRGVTGKLEANKVIINTDDGFNRELKFRETYR